MKLLSFFKLTYLLPTSLFLFISIVIAFLYMLTFLNEYTSDEHINKISSKSVNKDWTLISSIQELLSYRIQLVFDYLITSKLYLDEFYSNYGVESAERKDDFVKKHLINLKNYYVSRNNTNENLCKMAYIIDETDYKIIFTQENFATLEKKLQLQYKYLYLYSQLIPIFKSFYSNFERKDGFSLDSLYIMNRKTETFALYPLKHYSNYESMFSYFNEYKNTPKNSNNCRNKTRKIPEYFYAFCRKKNKNAGYVYKENRTRTMFITSPYQNIFQNKTENSYVISICHIFNFTQKNGTSEIDFEDYYLKFLNDEIVICADIKVDNYFQIFMNYEEQLSGYFYITKTYSKLPLFFPGMNDDPYPNDITRFEFNFTYYDFDTTDVVNFNTFVLPSLIKEYDDNDIILPIDENNNDDNNLLYYSVKNDKNSFQKGNLELNYYIYPIFFNKDKDNREHILSIIYVIDKNIYKNQLDRLSSKLNQIVYLSLFILIIIAVILAYIIHYLIYVFSMNITKPIKVRLQQNEIINKKKNAKFTYQGIDINKLIALGLILKKAKKHKVKSEQDEESSVSDFDRNSNDIFGRFIYGNEVLLKKNKDKDEESDNLLENENDNSKEGEEEDESEDEGILPIMIDSQFNDKVKLLYDLNKVRTFMRGEQVHLKGSNITKFISCQNIFNEMKDKLGENMCLSNVGNLENLNNKYDKSIIFFSKSLNIENNDEEINSKEILNIIDKIFDKDQKFKISHRENLNLSNSINTKISNKKEEKNKKKKQKEEVFDEINDMDDIQFHRFIKLFYAYNKYFSNVKTIENILNKTLHMTKTNNDKESFVYDYVKSALTFFNDYFILDIPKVHKSYKNAILICLKRLIESKIITKKKEKILYCFVELFHYYIAYLKIFIKRVINYINNSNNEDENENKNKSKTIDEIQRNQESRFHKVVNMAKKSQEYIIKMKSKIGIVKNGISEGEKAKYKEFLTELQKIEEKNYNIEFNVFLIEQKYYYYFAKFAKLCGDYSTAIIYYMKVIDEKRLISNGLLCLKSNKKICNIINFARYNPSFLSIHEKDEKKLNEIYDKCKKRIKDLQKVDYKDIIVVLDKNYSNKDVEKIYKLHMEQYKAITNIFENFISTNDRFGLYTYGDENFNYDEDDDEDLFINFIRNNSVKKIVGLSYKKTDNYGFIKGIIEKFHENIINDYENQSKMKQMYLNTEQNKNFSFNLDASLMKDKNNEIDDYYINKKKLKCTINIIFKVINETSINEEQRKKYVIIITESIKDELNKENNNEKLNTKELFKDINYISKSKIEKLYIIGSLLDEKNAFNDMSMELFSHGIKNEYLEFENISELNKKFQTIGTLPRKYEYFNEKLN